MTGFRTRAALRAAAAAAAAAAVIGAGAASGCVPVPAGPSFAGVYTRAGFHLVLECAGDATPHIVEYLYPANLDDDSYSIVDDHGSLTVFYGAKQIGTGTRDGGDATIHLTAIDDEVGGAVDWTLRGHLDTTRPWQPRIVSGTLAPGIAPGVTTPQGSCSFNDRSVFWWAEEPSGPFGSEEIAGTDPAAVAGTYTLFAWWARLGDVGPATGKGPARASRLEDLVSLAVSTRVALQSQDGVVLVDDHVTVPGRGVADGRGLWFRQVDHSAVDVTAAQAFLVRGASSSDGRPGVRRLLVGWLAGSMYVDPAIYPAGLTGPMGWTAIPRPGIVFWEDVDWGAAGPPGGAFAPGSEMPLAVRIASRHGRRVMVDGIVHE